MLKVYHYASLTREEAKRLNSSDGGWGSEPRFTRYADITMQGKAVAVIDGLIEREYTLVAVVDSDDLEDGFRFTNHIEHDWSKQPAAIVTPLPGSHRSTSVGDLIVRDQATYIVKPCGFTLLGEEPKRAKPADIQYLQVIEGGKS